MKSLLVLMACMIAGLSASAQGSVQFSNLGVGVNAPFRDQNGVPLSGSGVYVELLTGPTIANVTDSITPLFTGSFHSGYFNGDTRTVIAADVFAWPASPYPQAQYGTWAILRAWTSLGGTVTSFAQAQSTPGTGWGETTIWESPVQKITTLPPAAMFGMPLINGDGVIIVPEPSIVVLGVLGLSALLIRYRWGKSRLTATLNSRRHG